MNNSRRGFLQSIVALGASVLVRPSGEVTWDGEVISGSQLNTTTTQPLEPYLSSTSTSTSTTPSVCH